MKPRSDVELLADLEREASELLTAIAVLKRRIGVPANGPTGDGALGITPGYHEEGSIGKPFLGLSVLAAARKHLQRVKEPKSPSEIATALQQGGVHSRSRDFNGIVRTTLFKRGHEVGIEKFGSGKWGLQDWRPGRTRTSENAESES